MQPFNLAQMVAKDLPLKLLSLLLAVILWHFVGGENRINKNVMIPIEIINLPRDLVISNQFKKEIEVTVNGPRSAILEMDKRSVTRQVDLSKAIPGTMVIENDNEHIPVPRGVTVQRVQPASIILSLDKLVSKKFPVRARTVGRVARDYYVKEIKTDPDVITITGPQTTLMQFDELFTKPVNLDGVKKSAQIQVPLELDPAIVDLIGETSVTAEFVIGLETTTKTIHQVPVELDSAALQPEPSAVQITANIPKLLLRNWNRELREMFIVSAVPTEETDRFLVRVIKKPDIEVPIEILSIVPPNISVKRVLPNFGRSAGEDRPEAGTRVAEEVMYDMTSGEVEEENTVEKTAETPAQPIVRIQREKEKKVVTSQ